MHKPFALLILFVFAVFINLSFASYAWTEDGASFFARGQQSNVESNAENIAAAQTSPSFFKKISKQFVQWQAQTNKWLNQNLHQLVQNPNWRFWVSACFISLLYGILHAAGPGHAKTMTASYILANDSPYREASLLAIKIGFFHIFSAVILALILHFIFALSFVNMAEQTRMIATVCYGIIIIIGSIFLIKAWRLHPAQKEQCCPHHGDHDHKDHDHAAPQASTMAPHWRRLWFSLGVGAVPCPGPMLVLLYTLAQGRLEVGIFLSFFMALGMAVTIFAASMAVIFMKNKTIAFGGSETRQFYLLKGMRLIGAFIILLLGIILLWGQNSL